MFTIVTIRYNNQTWEANKSYRLKKKIQCIYASSSGLTESIDFNSPVFVIEMNNELNEIMGIGLIKNLPITDKIFKIQEDRNYNRFIFIGKYYISREILEGYNPFLIYVLDEILFKGKTHSKRGSGLTKIPEKVLKLDVCEDIDIKKEIRKIFIYHFKDKISEKKNKKHLTKN